MNKILGVVFICGLLSCLIISSVGASSISWSQILGEENIRDSANDIIQTRDGEYAVAGWKGIRDNEGNPTTSFWLIKIDSFGNIIWNKTFGKLGKYGDRANSLVETSDGGYAIAGVANFGKGDYDFCLVRTDDLGNLVWNQTYGGSKSDQASSIIQTSDDGFALAGYTQSFSDESYDFWLIKTDSFGNMQWNRTYEEEGMNYASCLVETSEGGFALGGGAWSDDSRFDFGLVKTDKDGVVEWARTYGGEKDDRATSLVMTSDGGLVLAGSTRSFGAGSADFWLIKTDVHGEMLWNKTFGGNEGDEATSLIVTSDGGLALVGSTNSFGVGEDDFWLVKTDGLGNGVWNQTFGGLQIEWASSLVETLNEEFILVGRTNSFGVGEAADIWVIKIDSTPTPTPSPEPFPTTLVLASVAVIAVVGIGIFTFFKKRRS